MYLNTEPSFQTFKTFLNDNYILGTLLYIIVIKLNIGPIPSVHMDLQLTEGE